MRKETSSISKTYIKGLWKLTSIFTFTICSTFVFCSRDCQCYSHFPSYTKVELGPFFCSLPTCNQSPNPFATTTLIIQTPVAFLSFLRLHSSGTWSFCVQIIEVASWYLFPLLRMVLKWVHNSHCFQNNLFKMKNLVPFFPYLESCNDSPGDSV